MVRGKRNGGGIEATTKNMHACNFLRSVAPAATEERKGDPRLFGPAQNSVPQGTFFLSLLRRNMAERLERLKALYDEAGRPSFSKFRTFVRRRGEDLTVAEAKDFVEKFGDISGV